MEYLAGTGLVTQFIQVPGWELFPKRVRERNMVMETGSEGAAWLSLHMEEDAIGEDIQGILEATAKPVSGILSGCLKESVLPMSWVLV